MQPTARGHALPSSVPEVIDVAVNTVPSAWPAEWRDVRMPKERMVVANEVLSLGAVRRVIDSYNV